MLQQAGGGSCSSSSSSCSSCPVCIVQAMSMLQQAGGGSSGDGGSYRRGAGRPTSSIPMKRTYGSDEDLRLPAARKTSRFS